MHPPLKGGAALAREIETTLSATPTLWWLGHSGFAIKFASITFYVDPCFSDPPGRIRRVEAPFTGHEIRNADLILCTHAHAGHMDGPALRAMLEASPQAKVALPKSAAAHAASLGIPYHRMTTTDSDLRIEYFRDGLYGRVYAVPSAHPELDWTAAGGYPYLGYLIRFGRWTVYHAGDCVMYPGLADRLRPYNVSVALLPISGRSFFAEAPELAQAIGARWVVPMHYGTFDPLDGAESRFVSHMLGHFPEQAFKVFRPGEMWTVPEE